MTEKEYYSIWTNYFKNKAKELERVQIVFNNFSVNSQWFLTLPQVTNKGILFSDDFGYSSFNELTILKICQEICFKLFKKMNLFLAFEKTIEQTLKNNVVRLFSQFGHQIYSFPETFELDENTVRRVFLLNKFNGGVYFKYDECDSAWYLKIFDNEGNLLDKNKQEMFLNNLLNNNRDIILSSEIRINELSYNKVFYLENNSEKFFDKFRFYFNDNCTININIKSPNQKLNLTNLLNNLGMLNNNDLKKRSDLIWTINNKSQVSLEALVKGRLTKINSDQLVYLYAEFMRERWNGKKVIVPLNTSEQILNFFSKNDISYDFENENYSEKNVAFYTSHKQFSSGEKFNFSLNNLDFIANLSYILASYIKKNNLLDNKIANFENEYASYLSEKESYSFNLENEYELNNIFRINQTFTKNLKIVEIVQWDYEDLHNKYLYKIKMDDSSVLKIWYKKADRKINILIESYKNPRKNFIQNQMQFKAIKSSVHKIINLIKK